MAPNKKNTVQNSTYVAQSSPLLLLCPETRNRIFEFVCEGTVMQYQRMTGSQPAYHEVENYFDGKPEPPGFLLVCKQLYYESIGVLYRAATFRFKSLYRMRAWFMVVSVAKLDLVKHLQLNEKTLRVPKDALVTEKRRRYTSAFMHGRWYGGSAVEFIE